MYIYVCHQQCFITKKLVTNNVHCVITLIHLDHIYTAQKEMPHSLHTKQNVLSMYAKVISSGLGLYAYVGRSSKLCNYWRYKFKKTQASLP